LRFLRANKAAQLLLAKRVWPELAAEPHEIAEGAVQRV
jgi:hypothetical protein